MLPGRDPGRELWQHFRRGRRIDAVGFDQAGRETDEQQDKQGNGQHDPERERFDGTVAFALVPDQED